MEDTTKKMINKCISNINDEVHKLELKISKNNDRWPQDQFGLKAEIKNEAIQKQIDELVSLQTEITGIHDMQKENENLKEVIKATMKDVNFAASCFGSQLETYNHNRMIRSYERLNSALEGHFTHETETV